MHTFSLAQFSTIMDEHCLPDASLARVADLVRCYLPIRTLVQFKLVNKEWRTWCDENLSHLGTVRRKEDSKDWYFPITVDLGGHRSLNPKPWWGLHQWTKEHHPLPDLNFLPPSTLKRERILHILPDLPGMKLEAISNGLLLLSRVEFQDMDLIVCNPLSKKWRILPRHIECCDNVMVKGYLNCTVQMHMVVDDMSKNYEVIRVSKEHVNVYSSSSNRWVCSPYAHPMLHNARPYYTTSFNGCVYIMEEQPYYWIYMVRVYVIESGKWLENPTSVTFDYTLGVQDRLLTNCLSNRESRRPSARIPCDPVLVECMGDLYGVGASIYPFNVPRGNDPFSVTMLFYIFKLTQEGRLIETPDRVVLSAEMQITQLCISDYWESFSCVATSSTIHLAWRAVYLLKYDVVSRLSTRINGVPPCFGSPSRTRKKSEFGMAYTPTLDMEP